MNKLRISKPIEVLLRVKPIFVRIGEGPCRWGGCNEFVPIENQDEYQEFIKTITSKLEQAVKLLPPLFVVHNEEFQINEEMLDKIAEDISCVDLYLFAMNGSCFDIAVNFAQRYKKPTMLATLAPFTSIVGASLLAKGMEVHPPLTLKNAARQLKSVRAKTALHNVFPNKTGEMLHKLRGSSAFN
jgi:hypothetical protein